MLANAAPASLNLSDRAAEVLLAAREILEKEGRDALTMRALAARLDIQAPSLYKHFTDKEALEVALMVCGFEEMAVAFERAVAGARPLEGLAKAYRAFGQRCPQLYALMTARPLPREKLPDGVEARTAAPLVRAACDADRARAMWAFAHGMVSLELAQRFPPNADLDAAWRAGIDALSAAPRPRRRKKP